jgi:hypothetical protein
VAVVRGKKCANLKITYDGKVDEKTEYPRKSGDTSEWH